MKKFIKKLFYFLSLFDYIKCVDCKFDGIGDAYCKPPLGECCFTLKQKE